MVEESMQDENEFESPLTMREGKKPLEEPSFSPAVEEEMQPEEEPFEEDEEEEDEKTSPLTIALVGAVIVALLAFLIWLYLPVIAVWVGAGRTPTPLPVLPTNTPRPTYTPTITMTATIEPTATATPYAPSAYSTDSQQLSPPLPWAPVSIFVLDDAKAVTPSPDFSDLAWSSSSVISTQLPAIVISEPYHTTLGRGSATWQMDNVLKPGLYELLVSDTLYSSASMLNFTVRLGQQELKPLTARQQIDFWTTKGNPPQVEDLWHSIGIYQIEDNDILSVSTSWEARDDFSGPVAIDRVVIVPQPENNVDLLYRLPSDRMKFILDETQANFEGADFTLAVEDQIAWNDAYQKFVNTSKNVKVVWQMQDTVPVGVYDVAVFIPEIQGNATVTYRLLANGQELSRTDGATLITSNQGKWAGGQWVLLGSWEIPRIFEPSVRLSLQMDILAGTPGEAAVDAVVFMTTPPLPATE